AGGGRVTPEKLRAFCLGFNASVEEFPFGPETSVFKVLGKMFALSALDARPLTVNLKCDPDEAVHPISASEIQNSGGVLVRYRIGDRGGEVSVAPGHFPLASSSSSRYRSDGFRFDSISAEVFDRVRTDLMERASVPEYDRDAVAAEVERNYIDETRQFVIRMDIAHTDDAEGLYTLDGRFIRLGA
ncbi:MmcQ/YjbR family DNA-binding protein, partial [Gordonia terrae]